MGLVDLDVLQSQEPRERHNRPQEQRRIYVERLLVGLAVLVGVFGDLLHLRVVLFAADVARVVAGLVLAAGAVAVAVAVAEEALLRRVLGRLRLGLGLGLRRGARRVVAGDTLVGVVSLRRTQRKQVLGVTGG